MEKEERTYRDMELHSEEVQEVMNRISPWLIRWGITVLFLVLIVVLIGCWIFKYPDTLVAEITLATEDPPAFVMSYSTGRLDTLYVKNGDMVRAGMDLGVIGSTAVSEDVRWLSKRMKEWQEGAYDWQQGIDLFMGRQLQLGDLQTSFATFITSLSEYARFQSLDYYAKKQQSQKRQLDGQRSYMYLAEHEYLLIEEDLKLAQNMYARDSTLYARNAMIAAEFEESESRYLQSLRSRESARMKLLQAKMQLGQYEEGLLDLQKQAYDEEHTRRVGLKNTVEQLMAQLSAWEHLYLLRSPSDGKVTFMKVWSRNQHIKNGETVFMIQPSDSSKVLGRALLPLQGSGKVCIGQTAYIRLENYPDQEFGYVKGVVESISPAPVEEGGFVLEIALPQGLYTNYGKQLPVARELKGKADIVLADQNVLQRLLASLKKAIEEGR